MNRTKIIKVPCFTAEASLFTAGNNYNSEGRYAYPASAKIMTPQNIDETYCYDLCIRAGLSEQYCRGLCGKPVTS